MKEVTIVYGKEQVNKMLQNAPLSPSEKEQYQKTFYFSTQEEVTAFTKGIQEAAGWQEVFVVE